jgi:hypothetical protein
MLSFPYSCPMPMRGARSAWRRRSAVGSAGSVVELTEELITAAMAKAEARVCLGHENAVTHSRIGWIVSKGGRESWDVWLEVATGLVKLIPQANA